MHWNLQGLYKAYSTFSTSKESFCCRTETFTTPFRYIKGTVLRIFAICAKDFLLVCLLGVKQTNYFYMALKTSLKAPKKSAAVSCVLLPAAKQRETSTSVILFRTTVPRTITTTAGWQAQKSHLPVQIQFSGPKRTTVIIWWSPT